MSEHTFNFGNWLSRLGFKGGEVPPVIQSVQPVQVVGDASLLVPSLLPPTAAYGDAIGGVAAEYAVAQIFSLANGGTLIREFCLVSAAAFTFSYQIVASPLTFGTTEDTLPAHNYGPDPVSSVVKVGTVVLANRVNTLTNPTYYCPARVCAPLADLIYLPRGYYLSACINSSANIPCSFGAVIQDLQASAGPE